MPPVAMKVIVASRDRQDRRPNPHTPWPLVQPYAMPLDALMQIAQNSGLMWVNSDSAKVAQVQAAIAAEPQPVHVPRERPAATPQDERPLILVETKRDLRHIELPFERTDKVE